MRIGMGVIFLASVFCVFIDCYSLLLSTPLQSALVQIICLLRLPLQTIVLVSMYASLA